MLQGVNNLADQLESGLKIKDGVTNLSAAYEREGVPHEHIVGSISRNLENVQMNPKLAIYLQILDITQDD
ncbi:hypothetical protein D3C75_1362040 [compost metagenome]